jgi:phosphoribosylaminoimidazolecarboxamide formyltransferase/IMP cyclohydrolase
MYRDFAPESFPSKMEISFYDSADRRVSLLYEKASWDVGGERKGLRYGDNPDQPAALYRLVNGCLAFGDVRTIEPGRYLASDAELLQSGKHPGKTNLTDVDSALSILRHLGASPSCAIIKHNNPCGAAKGSCAEEAYRKALMADRVAAFGGAVVLNVEVDRRAAEAIAASYCEVVAAPEYSGEALDVFRAKKNLRVMRIAEAARLSRFALDRVLDFRSLIDGGIVAQYSFATAVRTKDDFLPAECEKDGVSYRVEREPTAREWDDMLFGWLVETGITSNSVIYVKDGATVGIGTGEQDRVGVAEIARDKAYRKLEDRLCWERKGVAWNECRDPGFKASIEEEVRARNGGLSGSIMVSDGFFPFRDGIDVGLREGVCAVVQPGGSLRDFESIQACNERNAAMKFTGQRCFRH